MWVFVSFGCSFVSPVSFFFAGFCLGEVGGVRLVPTVFFYVMGFSLLRGMLLGGREGWFVFLFLDVLWAGGRGKREERRDREWKGLTCVWRVESNGMCKKAKLSSPSRMWRPSGAR